MRADKKNLQRAYCPLFSTFTRRMPHALVLSVGGEVDLAVEDDFQALLSDAVADAPGTLVLELSSAFLDIRAVTVLLQTALLGRDRGVRVVLAAPSPLLRRVLDVLTADAPLLPVYPGVDDVPTGGGR